MATKKTRELTGHDLDSFDQCILQLAIEDEKLTSAKQEEEERKKANELDQRVRLEALGQTDFQSRDEVVTWANRFSI